MAAPESYLTNYAKVCKILDALKFEGGSGSCYSGDNIHRQIVETYLLLFEAACEIGAEERFKA